MSQTVDPFDELAGLFLTDPDPPASGGTLRAPGRVELLVVGHLPVRAGLWLAPYADAIARRVGPTVLLRLDDTAPHLQVLRGSSDDLASIPPGTSLARAVTALKPRTSLWVVRPPADIDPAELATAGADRITILSSADEAARVDTYTLIKELTHAAERAGRPRPRLAMAILGSDEETAQRVFHRLNETTTSFLRLELSLALVLPRMDAGMVSGGYRRFTDERAPDFADVVRWIHRPDRAEPVAPPPADPAPQAAHEPGFGRGAAPAEAPAEAPADSGGRPDPVRDHGAGERPAPAVEPDHVTPSASAAPARPAAPSPSSRSGPESWVARRTVPFSGAAEVEVEPKRPCDAREPDREGRPVPFAEHVEGLAPLPVRCPGHELVELAIDPRGALHLLGREECLRRMQVVKRWAFAHRELIGMACPEHAIDVRRPPQLHLFTDRPTSLGDLHGSDISLHVLAPVKVGDQIGWYAAPLNQA